MLNLRKEDAETGMNTTVNDRWGRGTQADKGPFTRLDYLRSFTPFLPATVFFGPLRVRALVRVR
jgi:hypothetical protein